MNHKCATCNGECELQWVCETCGHRDAAACEDDMLRAAEMRRCAGGNAASRFFASNNIFGVSLVRCDGDCATWIAHCGKRIQQPSRMKTEWFETSRAYTEITRENAEGIVARASGGES